MNSQPDATVSESTEVAAAPDRIGSVAPASSRGSSGLFRFGLIGLAALLVYYALNAKVDDPVHLYLGLLIVIAAMVPALQWARRNDQRFPVFEVLMLTCVNTFAVPLLNGHQSLDAYSAETLSKAALAVLLYEVTAIMVYNVSRGRPRLTATWTEEVVTSNIADYLAYGMLITTAYTMINLLTEWIPRDLAGPLRAVCYGVGIISTFIQSRMWGQGTFPHHRKAVFVLQLILQVIFSWAALLLIGGISILVLALLGYVSGGKKLPMLAFALLLPILAVLHNGKSTMRDKYWTGGAPPPTLTTLPAFYSEWIGYGLQNADNRNAETSQKSVKLLERTSLFQIMCLVVDCTPARQPFLNGLTYTYVPPQLIPSFFWSGKPPSHIATYKLSIYYGLQREEDTARTTIAFGMVTEAYANFGYFGVALLGAVLAYSLKMLGDWATYSPILSYPGLLLVVLMAWSFQTELTMAAWVSSLYQACIAVLGVPFVIRNFLGR